eukprot:Nitzschia sp. Nitz4//scaffold292_size23309//4990//6312//NITZ4_008495-RA/size23309-processed-gene-0.7-mRNA-1//1//CDS//3329546164//5763//frame0
MSTTTPSGCSPAQLSISNHSNHSNRNTSTTPAVHKSILKKEVHKSGSSVSLSSGPPTQIPPQPPALPCLRTTSSQTSLLPPPRAGGMRREKSEPSRLPSQIKFDPRVWIREYPNDVDQFDSVWYSPEDLERFRRHAWALMLAYDQKHPQPAKQVDQVLFTGTGRTIALENKKGAKSASSQQQQRKHCLFTHPAMSGAALLCHERMLQAALRTEPFRAVMAQQEVRRILLVDPHDICLNLFRKAFAAIFPRAEIVAVRNAKDAMECLTTLAENTCGGSGNGTGSGSSSTQQQPQTSTQPSHRHRKRSSPLDIVLIEERLNPLFHAKRPQDSGSALFRTLSEHTEISGIIQSALCIGTSAFMKQDREAMESLVDVCWTKPPPKMSATVRNELLEQLLVKRGQWTLAQELFGTSPLPSATDDDDETPPMNTPTTTVQQTTTVA